MAPGTDGFSKVEQHHGDPWFAGVGFASLWGGRARCLGGRVAQETDVCKVSCFVKAQSLPLIGGDSTGQATILSDSERCRGKREKGKGKRKKEISDRRDITAVVGS